MRRLALAERLCEVQKASDEELASGLTELVGRRPGGAKTVVGHP